MIKKVTVTRVFKNDTNKDGIAYAFKKGKLMGQKFTRVTIKTEEFGEDMYSTCVPAGDRALSIEAGDKVVLKFSETNGFKNFNFPSKSEVEVYEQFNTEGQ